MSSSIEKQLLEIVGDYFDEVDDGLDEAVEEAAKVGAQVIKDASPKDRGKYKGGWKVDTENEHFGQHEAVIYNSTTPSLTHLLEHGHEQFVAGRDTGRFTPGQKHIEPGFEAAKEELDRRLR